MLPERFGRYEVLAEIGDGAMGRVYSAWDPIVHRVVAIKTVKSEYLTKEAAPEYLKRFTREAQAAGALNHPSIVRVFDVGEGYLVMEFVEGRTLHAVIRESGRLEPSEALRLLSPVAEAVDHAHRAGIIHRDIKPANIMVQPDGQVKLMDFGVVHLESSVMTTAGQVLGSPSYMSPEQIAGLPVTARSDVYSLAVVAYEMLTGQAPFQGKTITQIIYRVMHEPAPPPRQWNATLPPRYDEVFERALAKEPEKRYASAGELAAALELKEFEVSLLEAVLDAPEAGAPAIGSGGHDSPTVVLVPAPGEAAATLGEAAATPAAVKARKPVLVLAAVAAVTLGAVFLLLRRTPARPPVPPALESPAPSPTTTPPPAPAASAPPRAEPTTHVRPAPTPGGMPRRAATPTRAPVVVEGQLVKIGPDVTPPRRIAGDPAPYPERARRLRLSGTVTVSLIVDENGRPADVHVMESAGSILDEAVLKAVRTWRFEPARKGGVRVKVRWTVKVTFRAGR